MQGVEGEGNVERQARRPLERASSLRAKSLLHEKKRLRQTAEALIKAIDLYQNFRAFSLMPGPMVLEMTAERM